MGRGAAPGALAGPSAGGGVGQGGRGRQRPRSCRAAGSIVSGPDRVAVPGAEPPPAPAEGRTLPSSPPPAPAPRVSGGRDWGGGPPSPLSIPAPRVPSGSRSFSGPWEAVIFTSPPGAPGTAGLGGPGRGGGGGEYGSATCSNFRKGGETDWLAFEHIFYVLGVGGVVALLRQLKKPLVIFKKKQFVK